MLEEAKKKSPAKKMTPDQLKGLARTQLKTIHAALSMMGERKPRSPEEQKKKMSPAKLARRMKEEEKATGESVKQAKKSYGAVGKQQKKADIEKIKQAAAEKTKKVQGAPRQAGPAGIHSEIKDRIDAHSKQEFLHNTPISNLLADLNNIQHQVDVAHAQKKLSDTHHEHFSSMIDRTKDAHRNAYIASADFDTLQNAIEKNHLPVTKELLDLMYKLAQSEIDPSDYKKRWERDRRINTINQLAASIGLKPTTTKKTKRFMGIPYGSKEEIKNIYESKKHKKHPHVKVSGQSEEKYTERGGIEGKKSNPPSGSSSGEEWLEQTIHTIKDVILERTAGRPAPIKHSRVGTTYGRRRANVYVIGSSLRHRLDRYRKNALRDRLGLLQRRSRRLTNG